MTLAVTFSKPVKNISEILGDEYVRIKIKLMTSSIAEAKSENYFVEMYTQKQVFHKKFSEAQLMEFIEEHAGKTFKSCVQRTEKEEITILANKKGKITRLVKENSDLKGKIRSDAALGIGEARSVAGGNGGGSRSLGKPDGEAGTPGNNLEKLLSGKTLENHTFNRKKNYILPEGQPVPFLVHLGIMTAEGKVISSKYDKFRQINRFLEFVDDIIGDVLKQKKEGEAVNVVDFGSGKSYLTFAVHYYLSEIKKIPCRVFGLDLKKDVIQYCNQLAKKLGLENISFAVGNIADFDRFSEGEKKNPDMIITLHACDTATDYALDYAIRHEASAILSVPCCQHEINSQFAAGGAKGTLFEPLLKYGLIKERFSALLTDAVRGILLEEAGYKVQMLEFIDENATPKNLLIRAVKNGKGKSGKEGNVCLAEKILGEAGVTQTLCELR